MKFLKILKGVLYSDHFDFLKEKYRILQSIFRIAFSKKYIQNKELKDINNKIIIL